VPTLDRPPMDGGSIIRVPGLTGSGLNHGSEVMSNGVPDSMYSHRLGVCNIIKLEGGTSPLQLMLVTDAGSSSWIESCWRHTHVRQWKH
jgi:hypothetical protein